MIRPLLALFLLLPTLPATAQQADVQTALATLPPDVAERIAARPDRFADTAIDLIHGHGTGGAIDAAGIDRALALDRAFFRTRALRSFHESDLDADGAVALPEITARAATLTPPARARLLRDRDAADTDADGTLTPDELRAHATAEAARATRPEDEALLRAILAFDGDGDGRVTAAEIRQATDALSQG